MRVVDIVSFVLVVAEWLCGLGAIALLWRAESSAYFKARSAAALAAAARFPGRGFRAARERLPEARVSFP